MITLVLNAFPRTGSTILWRMAKEENPDALHLYEPLHDKLFHLIHEETNVLHGASLWDDYKAIDPAILNEMILKHKDCTNLYRFDDVRPYLDAINRIENDVILQPNRMHFILADVAQEYNCKVVHLTRGPADCFLGFVEIFAMYGENLMQNYNRWIDTIYGFVGFFQRQYNAIAKKFDAPKVTEFLDKFLVVWAYCNYYAVTQADENRVMITSLEDVADGNGIEKIEEFSGLKLKRGLIDKKRVYLADGEFKEKVEDRIQNLGLIRMTKRILEASQQ